LPETIRDARESERGQVKRQFNNRENPWLFRDTLKQLIGSEQVEYKELIA
jgi:hypothetical protein